MHKITWQQQADAWQFRHTHYNGFSIRRAPDQSRICNTCGTKEAEPGDTTFRLERAWRGLAGQRCYQFVPYAQPWLAQTVTADEFWKGTHHD